MPSGSNQLFGDLIYERIDDTSILSDFYCGIKEMDDFIHYRLQDHINDEHLDTYIVRQGATIVALISLKPDAVQLDDDDKDDMLLGVNPKPEKAFQDHELLEAGRFDAIEIAYLAVDHNWHHQGLGKFIINTICEKATSDYPNCEFITVQAYHTAEYSPIGFYRRCLFFPAELPNPASDVLKMYRVLHPHI